MPARHALRVVSIMTNENREPVTVERFERRLAEECGKLRLEIGGLRHDTVEGLGKLRTEVADRNAEQLKWLLVFFTAQTGALVAVLSLFR